VRLDFLQIVATGVLRVFVLAGDLSPSERADMYGIVRICELLLILPDGKESGLVPVLQP
jgi:hypothetical protein